MMKIYRRITCLSIMTLAAAAVPAMAQEVAAGGKKVAGNEKLVVSSKDLVGWWKMNEGSGNTIKDSSGNEHNGTVTEGSWWVTGKSGNALEFAGTGYVDVGTDINLANSSFSLLRCG